MMPPKRRLWLVAATWSKRSICARSTISSAASSENCFEHEEAKAGNTPVLREGLVARFLQLNQPASRSIGDRFGSTDDVELGKNAFHVRLHGAFTNKESRANLLVALPLRHQFEHVTFALAHRFAADAFRELGSEMHGHASFASMHAANEVH